MNAPTREEHLRAALEGDGLKALDYAWAAGVLEGEGCLSIFKRPDRPNTTSTAIHCEMTDEDVIRRLHAIFGVGTVNGRTNVGNRKDTRLRKPTWIWSVQNMAGISNVLFHIWFYLGERRREKAAEVLRSLEERGAF